MKTNADMKPETAGNTPERIAYKKMRRRFNCLFAEVEAPIVHDLVAAFEEYVSVVAASSKEATPTCTCGKSNYPCAVHNREDFNNCEVTRVRAQYEREAVERVLAARIKVTEMGAEATPSPATKETHITPHGSVINTDLCVSCICGKHLIWRYLEDEDTIQVFHCDVKESAAPSTAREETPWRDAVEEACSVNHQAFIPSEAKKTLAELIRWEVRVALDPKVSKAAQDLFDAGARSLVVAPQKEIAPELEKALQERNDAISGRKHTQDWYARHYGKLHDWARKRLPEQWAKEFFNCVANGTWGHDDVDEPYMSQVGRIVPSGYFKMDSAAEQLLHDQTTRAEIAEMKFESVWAGVAALPSTPQQNQTWIPIEYCFSPHYTTFDSSGICLGCKQYVPSRGQFSLPDFHDADCFILKAWRKPVPDQTKKKVSLTK